MIKWIFFWLLIFITWLFFSECIFIVFAESYPWTSADSTFYTQHKQWILFTKNMYQFLRTVFHLSDDSYVFHHNMFRCIYFYWKLHFITENRNIIWSWLSCDFYKVWNSRLKFSVLCFIKYCVRATLYNAIFFMEGMKT